MTDPNARHLIQRLADALTAHHQLPGRVPLLNEARAYLAQPEPVTPTNKELFAIAVQARLYSFQPTAGDPVIYELSEAQMLAYARAVLARWGNHAPQPIPISERLPGEEDCDAEGRCWVWNPEMYWWELCPLRLITINAGDPYDYWLPHWAIPTPQEQP